MLCDFRVKSKAVLADWIYRYFEEVNVEQVVFHSKYNLYGIDVSEEIIVDALPLKKVQLIGGRYNSHGSGLEGKGRKSTNKQGQCFQLSDIGLLWVKLSGWLFFPRFVSIL